MELPPGTKLPAGHFYFKPKYQTDKFETGLMHEYLTVLQAYRYRPIRFLEIGTGQGGSLRYFEDYFEHPKNVIVGMDRHKPLQKVTFKENTHLLIGQQNDAKRLNEIGKEYGKFDVILDDGAHTRNETLHTFQQLYKYVKPGGYYIIEDWAAEFIGEKYAGMMDLMLHLFKKTAVVSASETTLKLGHSFSYLMIRKKLNK